MPRIQAIASRTRKGPSKPAELRPPLKWAGGKRWQVPHLQPLWKAHSHRRLVEPFCGGLAVSLGLNPRQALLNDVNPHLINFYQWLKRGLVIDLDMRNDERQYYRHRTRFNDLLAERKHTKKDAAALFYYLNRTGYNGLCRFNRSGEFNVPFGRYKTIGYVKDFSPFAVLFARWDFSSTDFEGLPLEPDDFVYADPPYDVEFTSYSQGGFSWADQVRTAKWLVKHRGPVVLVNQATEKIMELYSGLGYKISSHKAPRRINCTGDRTPADEVMATRNI
ncbi:MAG TPA: Dam family site-specific DNA-(adenine-N6)-methyltransferase [Candidatus Polarisedimenticolia bacterium]|nr:Dam family site-specific DNA-(adenine-N6)-methyltransferase [Candidatus Polarisedimenticolia bacterium]